MAKEAELGQISNQIGVQLVKLACPLYWSGKALNGPDSLLLFDL